MNKQAYTPERWEAIGLTAIATAGTSGRIIANVTPPGDFATPQEVERIRALIAAAPELVEALRSLIDQADAQFSVGDRHATFNKRTIDSFRVVLNKAI